jgi:hypothetical protein
MEQQDWHGMKLIASQMELPIAHVGMEDWPSYRYW